MHLKSMGAYGMFSVKPQVGYGNAQHGCWKLGDGLQLVGYMEYWYTCIWIYLLSEVLFLTPKRLL